MAVRRRAAQVLDLAPVLILAAIAGAGSFVHIRDTAAEHGQRGPMSWAIAVCIDLTCVMAARERQRDKRTGRPTRPVTWPTIVLTGGVLASLAANLEQAQPTTWGRIVAATPAAAFLVAVSMLGRRTSANARSDAPILSAALVPAQDEPPSPVPAVLGQPRSAAARLRPPSRRRAPGDPWASDHPRRAALPARRGQPARLRLAPPAPDHPGTI